MYYEWLKILGPTFYPLFLCSILSLAIIMERVIFLLHATFTYRKNYNCLVQHLQGKTSYSKLVRDEMLSLMLSELQSRYYRNLKMLKLIASIAPMLGLLGTVLGLLASFKEIAAATSNVSPSVVAAGLFEALYTTVYGLCIAIPSLFFAHFFKLWGEKILGSFCASLNRLSIKLSKFDEGDNSVNENLSCKHI
jgi:biopolymer transport protein ExbB